MSLNEDNIKKLYRIGINKGHLGFQGTPDFMEEKERIICK